MQSRRSSTGRYKVHASWSTSAELPALATLLRRTHSMYRYRLNCSGSSGPVRFTRQEITALVIKLNFVIFTKSQACCTTFFAP